MKMENSPESRWVCGKGYDGEYVLVELRGRVTGCYFWVDTKWDEGKSHRKASKITSHSNRLRKDDKRLHLTRGDAIVNMLVALRTEREKCQQRITEIDTEIDIVDRLDVGSA